MSSTTANLELYVPAKGETGWDSEVNNNFTIIDRAIAGVDSQNSASLSDAITAASGKTLIITTDYTVSSNTAIDSSVVTYIPKGNVLTIDPGVTLTINGPLIAGLYQIFSGTGTVAFGSGAVSEIYPQWWGGDPTDASEDSTAVQAAITAATSKADVILTSGTWTLDDITLTANLRGREGAVVTQANAANDVFTCTVKVIVEGFTVNMLSGSTQAAFVITTDSAHNMHSVFRDLTIDGVAAGGGTALGFEITPVGAYGIDHLLIQDIYGLDLDTLIQFNTDGSSWINGNVFKNIWGYNMTYVVDWNAATPVNSNSFESVRGQYNAGIPMTAVIADIQGQRNTFINCEAYDGGLCLNFTKESYNNLVMVPMTLLANPANYFQDLGIMNEFIWPNRDYIFANFHEDFVGAAPTARWHSTGTGSIDMADNLTYGGLLIQTGTTSAATEQVEFDGALPWSGYSKNRIMWKARLGSTAAVTVEMGVRGGGSSTHTISFKYGGSGNWQAVSHANDGTESTADTGKACDTSLHVYTITKMGTTGIYFAIDTSNVASITSTNNFSLHYEPFFYISNSTNANKTLQLCNFDARLY